MSDVEKLVKKWSKDDLIAFVVAHSRDDAESLEMWRLQRELKVAGAEAQSLRERQESALEVLDAELGGPGSKFPGQGTVERKTRALCEKQGKKWSGKQKYPGWWAIWPTAVGWRQGHRSAQCFVPYQQYAKQLEIDAAKKNPVPTPAPTAPTDPQPAPAAS